jgi:hypothetical protein
MYIAEVTDTANATRLVRLARSLLAKGGALQSTNTGDKIEEAHLRAALERHIKNVTARADSPPLQSLTAKAAASEALASAERVLNKFAGGGSSSNLTELEFASLEAIIQVTGRPAMRYSDGRVEMPPSGLGENDRWRVLVATARSKINKVSASVGRIAVSRPGAADEHAGTAWRLGDDLVVTNRHVARELAGEPSAASRTWKIDAVKWVFVDFAVTDNAASTQRFAIGEIAYCAEEEDVDFAVLRFASAGAALPPALTMDWTPAALGGDRPGAAREPPHFRGEEIYVVGHPYRQRGSEAIAAVFGEADGCKRCSPGTVVSINASRPIFEHDCSTLGGNSGSCVFTVERHAVIGLHFGARSVDDVTGRGTTNLALALSQLGTHRAAEILRTGRM